MLGMEHDDSNAESMKLGHLASLTGVALREVLDDNPPAPPFLTELEPYTQDQWVEGGENDECFPDGADDYRMTVPSMYQGAQCQEDPMYSGYWYSETGAYDQGQELPYQWPVDAVPTATAVGQPAPTPQTYNDFPVSLLEDPQSVAELTDRAGVFERPAQVLPPPLSHSPPPNTQKSKKRKYVKLQQEEEDRPYTKKPPNAFMLFLREQRPQVEPKLQIKGSGAVNALLGERWRSMTKKQQAKYYDEAEQERLLHQELHPGWSNTENYGKKRKRIRKRVPTGTTLSP